MLGDGRQWLDDGGQEDADSGHYRCKRNIFTDPVLLELGMKRIFEGDWIFMANESQVPGKNDDFHHFHGPPGRVHRP